MSSFMQQVADMTSEFEREPFRSGLSREDWSSTFTVLYFKALAQFYESFRASGSSLTSWKLPGKPHSHLNLYYLDLRESSRISENGII